MGTIRTKIFFNSIEGIVQRYEQEILLRLSGLKSWRYLGAELVSVHVEAWYVSELWPLSFRCSKLEGLRRHGDIFNTVLFNCEKSVVLTLYRVVQLNFTPEIEVFDMLFERSLSLFSRTPLKQHIH